MTDTADRQGRSRTDDVAAGDTALKKGGADIDRGGVGVGMLLNTAGETLQGGRATRQGGSRRGRHIVVRT
jgi:hypothetical protein